MTLEGLHLVGPKKKPNRYQNIGLMYEYNVDPELGPRFGKQIHQTMETHGIKQQYTGISRYTLWHVEKTVSPNDSLTAGKPQEDF